ncbi:MAG: hypothetical protein U0136_21645 [Bdellovibrionota bacterium]
MSDNPVFALVCLGLMFASMLATFYLGIMAPALRRQKEHKKIGVVSSCVYLGDYLIVTVLILVTAACFVTASVMFVSQLREPL